MSDGSLRYDVTRIREDMEDRGWLQSHLARKSRLSEQTISRFLRGDGQTAPTAKKIAEALGRSIRRYRISSRNGAAA